ncbi:MAG TPA: NADH-ubiquinone oxidoreductase-F iron-sulfur binding region domain-containing protein [Acidimicrobiales bacterium]|nr:NADH-ubiquinone oxidoreductase-F iron-sulfur binding region domain-containing protein [Acidimicrobiales bacterium]
MSLPLLALDDLACGSRRAPPAFGIAGEAVTRLLAGPAASAGAEPYAAHVARLGPPGHRRQSPEELRSAVGESGLLGRGGGEFPLSRKLDLAVMSPGDSIVVVNASEGEPASRKDATLLELRPHLVLDGADAVAAAVGATEIVVYLHRGRSATDRNVVRALIERDRVPGAGATRVRLVDAPDRYVAGEASAVVRFMSGGAPAPRRTSLPPAASGVGGRPTVVSNAETYAHVALIARYGAAWFATAGSTGSPGSTLLTLAGDVAAPGTVVESLGPTTIGSILSGPGGLAHPPVAVLIGGYSGSWVDGGVAWATPLDRHALANAGVRLGCGLVAVLGTGACGIAETARLLRWLAGESAGQCGPCAFGLPAIADLAGMLADGRARRSDVRELRRLAASVRGRGACGHPTGVAELVESALDTFAVELRRHLGGRACASAGAGFPLPQPASTWPRS